MTAGSGAGGGATGGGTNKRECAEPNPNTVAEGGAPNPNAGAAGAAGAADDPPNDDPPNDDAPNDAPNAGAASCTPALGWDAADSRAAPPHDGGRAREAPAWLHGCESECVELTAPVTTGNEKAQSAHCGPFEGPHTPFEPGIWSRPRFRPQ